MVKEWYEKSNLVALPLVWIKNVRQYPARHFRLPASHGARSRSTLLQYRPADLFPSRLHQLDEHKLNRLQNFCKQSIGLVLMHIKCFGSSLWL